MGTIEPMPGHEDLINFIESAGTGEQDIPQALYIDLIALLEETRDFELEFIINSIKDGVVAAVEQKSETEGEAIRLRLDKLEGSNSNFFLELLFSIIIEYNLIGRLVHLGAKSLGKVIGPAIARRPLRNSYKQNRVFYSRFVASGKEAYHRVIESKDAFKKMMLGIAEQSAKKEAAVLGRDTVTAFAGPISQAVARKKIRDNDTRNSQNLHLASNISLTIKGGLENYKKTTRSHYSLLIKEIKKHEKGLIDPPMTMEVFRDLVEMHHYNQDIDSNEINKLVAEFVKKVIWTLVLQENNGAVNELVHQALGKAQLPNPAVDLGWTDRAKALKMLEEDKLAALIDAGQPLKFIPGQRFLHDKDIIMLLAREFSIHQNEKIASIYEHAFDEFPKKIQGINEDAPGGYLNPENVEALAERNKRMQRFLGSSYRTDPLNSAFMDLGNFEENSKNARQKFMQSGVWSVLNDMANMLEKHKLGDLDWLIVNDVSDLTGKD